MLRRNLYFIYISLYASFNTAIGLHIIGSFAYSPGVDLRHLADLVTGLIVLVIGMLCFVGLTIRRDKSIRKVYMKRNMAYLLVWVFLPLLIGCLIINLLITPSLGLLVASILSALAAITTFILVTRRLHDPVFRSVNKR